ncbi:MAG: right-handed parallel beta-helix repeat-containing protein [Roseburia sp.]|nr:right-handed parallel beta-helix repeat-containing protein [Anaeroplasma bactoclasticum]MCM1196453.1 right-handed parallel beta-helix repeat-containing protein [Roseburia sp.]MCM1556569.1 right-handed parallel beta-helix repeat-containing protein [Anaeroplasma bactoclasticum]
MKKRKFIPALLLMGIALVGCKGNTTNQPIDPNPPVEKKTIYMSTSGKSTNEGTQDSPYDAYTAFKNLSRGDTLKVMPGTYNLPTRIFIEETQSGDMYNYITVENDSTDPAIFDFSAMAFEGTNRGITVNGSYWHFNNIEVKGAGDNGMYIGGSFNIVENCLFHENRDTGLQIGRASGGYNFQNYWPCNNLIKNCTSYNNYDDVTYGENADGFAAKLTVGFGNVFDGCIAYRNSDDGWDLFAKQDSGNIGTVILYNCLSFENGFLLNKVTEAGVERFTTRDGDGIGFKLGGSTMKGDVILENCVSFNNRLQGIGDNSNPGVISVKNCTAFNNCATIDENGVVDTTLSGNDTESCNFDLARSEASYNNYENLLSYVNNKTATADKFLGSMKNSVVYMGGKKYNRIENVIDASSRDASKRGVAFDGMNDDVFKDITSMNGLNNREIHKTLRNADGSIQLGDFLSLNDKALKESGVGADLTKTSYDQYKHFVLQRPTEELSEEELKVLSAYDVLEVNCNPEAVFQDMLAPTIVNGCTVNWISSDPNTISVGEEVITSLSNSSEIVLSIYRPKNENKEVTLTAEIEYKNALLKKTFTLTVMKDTPGIGTVSAEGVVDGKLIINQYDLFSMPRLIVTNSASYSGKILDESEYEVERKIEYGANKKAKFYVVDDVYTSRDGVYKVNYKITSKTNVDDVKTLSYLIFVNSASATIDFDATPTVDVNRDGYAVTAALTYVSGYMYVLDSNNEIETIETIKSSGNKIEITDDVIYQTFKNENTNGYYVHMVVENLEGSVISEVKTAQVKFQEITSEAEFMAMTTGSTNSSTIYLLTKDLDFANVTITKSSQTFVGLFNGQNHKISNISLNDSTGYSIFYKMKNGTIMNVEFENISITAASSSAQYAGLIGQMNGGYIHNVKIRNINVDLGKAAADRSAAVVGRIGSGYNYFTQIGVYNDADHKIVAHDRIAAIIGFVQDESSARELTIEMSNCHVVSDIEGYDYVGGLIGRFDDRQDYMKLTVTNSVYSGHITAHNYCGGILAGFNNGVCQIDINNCASNFECVYNQAPFITGLKNCSPIIGRNPASSGTGYSNVVTCYGSYAEYNQLYDSSKANLSVLLKELVFWTGTLNYDLENIWIYDAETKTVTLR